jgi:16S rRNA (cytidine1402-2'-O)-methyltransferase
MLEFTGNYCAHVVNMEKGNLFIIATPIGNLSDISLRALDVLKEVDLILSEDTRETDKILKKYEIEKTQLSYRDQNHEMMLPKIEEFLDNNLNVALISDSGTPLISDPGYKLVRELIRKGFNIISIPGPSAVISALVISGFPTDKFSFLGFLPKSSGERSKILKIYGSLDSTLVIYESPFRIEKLLKEINENLGDRFVCLANEITKIHEKVTRGRVSMVLETVRGKRLKGEFVVLVGKEDFYL